MTVVGRIDDAGTADDTLDAVERLSWPGTGTAGLLDRALALLDAGPLNPRSGRAVLGIAGAPASGKSTLAALLMDDLERERPGAAVAVGMDAFHIGHRVLVEQGRTDVKGAPETFDVGGYVHLLRRIRNEPGPIYAPEFVREIEDSLANVVEVGPDTRLVVTEGNYLLLNRPPWDGVRELLDQAWFVRLDDDERRRRMVLRHLRHGHDPEEARIRTFGSDEQNALLVDGNLNRPDLVIEHVFDGSSLGS
jgi:pantothenate kinase